MTINHRIKEFVDFKGLNNSEFGRQIGSGRNDVSGWFNENKMVAIPPKKVLEIIKVFKDLNARWLITGEGSMLEDPQKIPTKDDLPDQGGNLLDRLLDERGKASAFENEIKHLNLEIERLKKKCGEQDRESARAG
jgi:hypothetical protein